MTPLLAQAIERIRALPSERQDEIARLILALLDEVQSDPPTVERFQAICAKHGLPVSP